MKKSISEVDKARIVSLTMEGSHMVRDLLQDGENFADINMDILATLLSETSPEECLLVLACSAHHMARYGELDSAVQVALKHMADTILDDYAPSYIGSRRSKPQESIDCAQALACMQEDFESFAEIYAIVGDISDPHTAQHHIALILSDQASSHAEAIDYVDYDNMSESDAMDISSMPAYQANGSNVILFPKPYRTH